MNQGWITKPQNIYIDFVGSWLRCEIEHLEKALKTIERLHDYHDDYVVQSIKETEIALRQMRKFIEAN